MRFIIQQREGSKQSMHRTKKEQDMSCSEAGRIGGKTTLARYGREHFQKAGLKGQAVLANRYNNQDRSQWGAMGGRPRKAPIILGEEK